MENADILRVLTGRHYLQGLLYRRVSSFSDMGSFMGYIDPLFRNTKFNVDGVFDAYERIKEPKFVRSDNINVRCLNILVREEFESSINLLSRHDISEDIKYHENIIGALNDYNIKIHGIFSDLGIFTDIPSLYFVKNFPHPFENNKMIAMSFDNSDRLSFGINPGLYFRVETLRPLYSVFLLFHEWIHVVMSRHSEPFFGGPLEEGLAEVYGCLFLGSKLLGYDLANSLFIYHRLFSRNDKTLDLYLDYARQAAAIFEVYGESGLVDILKGTRARLKILEKAMWAGGFLDMQISSGKLDPEFGNLLRKTLFMYGKNSVCSPLAMFVSRYTSANMTVKGISELSDLPLSAVADALVELSQSPRLVEMKGDVVVYSDCERLVHPLQLRFKVPEDVPEL